MFTRLRLLLLASLLLAAACSSVGTSANPTPIAATSPAETVGEYQTLSIDEFASVLQTEGDTYTVVNVHIPYEGEIEGTDVQAAYNDTAALTAALPDKNAPIILYCRSGRMSEIASQALVELGYTRVWDVPGGMNAWLDSGRDLINR